MEEVVSELFKEFSAEIRFRWKGMNPEYKRVWKTLGVCLAVLAGAAVISGLALLIGPR